MAPHILKQNVLKSHARCGSFVIAHDPLGALNWTLFRYGPRQSKSSAYHEIGRLSVEVKFTPFSSLVRRVPIRVSSLRLLKPLISFYYFSGCGGQVYSQSGSTSTSPKCAAGLAAKICRRHIHNCH